MIKYRKDGTIETDKFWNLTPEDYQEIAGIITDRINLPILEKNEGLWTQQDKIENRYRAVDRGSRKEE